MWHSDYWFKNLNEIHKISSIMDLLCPLSSQAIFRNSVEKMIKSAEQVAFYITSGLGWETHQGFYHMQPTPYVYFYIALEYDRRYDRAAEGETFATSMQDFKCHITTLWLWDSIRPLEKGSYGFVKHGSATPLISAAVATAQLVGSLLLTKNM